MQRTPKIINNFHEIFWKAEGRKRPIAKLKSLPWVVSLWLKALCQTGRGDLPVRDCRERHARSSGFQRPDLCSIHPSNRRQGQSVDENKDIDERNDGVGGTTGDLDSDTEVSLVCCCTAEPVWQVGSVTAHHAANDEQTDTHSDCTINQERSSSHFVDEEERCLMQSARTNRIMASSTHKCADNKDSILDSTTGQANVASHIGHIELVVCQ